MNLQSTEFDGKLGLIINLLLLLVINRGKIINYFLGV